jgi:hypothetical protein
MARAQQGYLPSPYPVFTIYYLSTEYIVVYPDSLLRFLSTPPLLTRSCSVEKMAVGRGSVGGDRVGYRTVTGPASLCSVCYTPCPPPLLLPTKPASQPASQPVIVQVILSYLPRLVCVCPSHFSLFPPLFSWPPPPSIPYLRLSRKIQKGLVRSLGPSTWLSRIRGFLPFDDIFLLSGIN